MQVVVPKMMQLTVKVKQVGKIEVLRLNKMKVLMLKKKGSLFVIVYKKDKISSSGHSNLSRPLTVPYL